MRRSPIVLAATVAGTAGVLAFHPHTVVTQTAAASTASPSPTPTVATGSGGASGGDSGTTTAVSGTATGDAVDTQYGAAQVRVTVKARKIVKIEALQLQGNDPRSVQISGSA